MRIWSAELHSLYGSPNKFRVIKSRRLRWEGHITRILTGKPIGKRPLGRPRLRWEENIRGDSLEIGTNKRSWVDSDALVIAALSLRVP